MQESTAIIEQKCNNNGFIPLLRWTKKDCYIFGKYEFSAMGLPVGISLGGEGELLHYIFVHFDGLGLTSKMRVL